jgi:hypothetical protein
VTTAHPGVPVVLTGIVCVIGLSLVTARSGVHTAYRIPELVLLGRAVVQTLVHAKESLTRLSHTAY